MLYINCVDYRFGFSTSKITYGVHNEGRISKDLEKYTKFGIGYREEDKQIYLEYQDIIKLYDAMLEFMDRAFRIEPIVNMDN